MAKKYANRKPPKLPDGIAVLDRPPIHLHRVPANFKPGLGCTINHRASLAVPVVISGKVYVSMFEAARELGVPIDRIRQMLTDGSAQPHKPKISLPRAPWEA